MSDGIGGHGLKKGKKALFCPLLVFVCNSVRAHHLLYPLSDSWSRTAREKERAKGRYLNDVRIRRRGVPQNGQEI